MKKKKTINSIKNLLNSKSLENSFNECVMDYFDSLENNQEKILEK